jgi:hypothetical protein
MSEVARAAARSAAPAFQGCVITACQRGLEVHSHAFGFRRLHATDIHPLNPARDSQGEGEGEGCALKHSPHLRRVGACTIVSLGTPVGEFPLTGARHRRDVRVMGLAWSS